MENILLSYLSLDVGKGVVLSPIHWATPTGTMHSELLSCFQKTCAAVRDVLVGGVERGGEEEEEESEDEYDWGSEEEEEEEEKQEGKVGLFSYLTLPSPPCECNLFSLSSSASSSVLPAGSWRAVCGARSVAGGSSKELCS